MKIINKRLSEEEFFRERKEVFGMCPTGKEVYLDKAIEFYKSLLPRKNYALELQQAKQAGVTYFCTMMATAPLERDIEF